MDQPQVHYEVYIRRTPAAGWTLDVATEDRAQALAAAHDRISEGRAAAKVTKETFDSESRGFRTAVILTLGAAETPKPAKVRENNEPLCVTPQDLYTIHARDRIGRLLDGWLERQRATPFELLHRPDLVERLEASGVDLQHAIQKIAVPEAQARGLSVHEMMRTFNALVERAIEKLLKDKKKGLLPDVDKEGFASAAERVAREPERGYLLGAGVAASIAPARTWSEKVGRLLDLADAAPMGGPAKTFALQTVQQPLAEILESKVGVTDLLGHDLDLGGSLAAMTRLAAGEAVEMLIKADPSIAAVMPDLSEAAARLAKWLATEDFKDVRTALGRRILRELNGPRRLRPNDATGEIALLRALAMVLTATAGQLLPPDDVQAAFVARSKMLVTSEFVESYLGHDRGVLDEAKALIWLVENVIGGANKRQAGRWLAAAVTALRFEKDLRNSTDSASQRLQRLADLQRSVARCGLVPEDCEVVHQKLGELGGMIEADVKLTASLANAGAPAIHRLMLLLKLATGEAAPIGPAAERARAEAMRLVRLPETRSELAGSPERFEQVKDLIQRAGVAA